MGETMKVVQIFHGKVYTDLSSKFKSSKEAAGHFASNIVIVDAPDYVFPGWEYNAKLSGDNRFIRPSVPEGMEYDDETGTVWNPEVLRSSERKARHSKTTDDTMQALRKIREGDTSFDWEGWLAKLDAYNVAIEETKNQEDYPLKVEYPEYPKR